jgi:hypothetical protein
LCTSLLSSSFMIWDKVTLPFQLSADERVAVYNLRLIASLEAQYFSTQHRTGTLEDLRNYSITLSKTFQGFAFKDELAVLAKVKDDTIEGYKWIIVPSRQEGFVHAVPANYGGHFKHSFVIDISDNEIWTADHTGMKATVFDPDYKDGITSGGRN